WARSGRVQGGRVHVVEAEAIAVAPRAVVGYARMSGRSHHIRRVIARRSVALGARRSGRDVVGGLRRAARLVGGEGGRSCMAALAVTRRRVRLVESLRAGVSPGGCAARDRAYIRSA